MPVQQPAEAVVHERILGVLRVACVRAQPAGRGLFEMVAELEVRQEHVEFADGGRTPGIDGDEQ